jgi:enoyl-[acyl-carrier-protein] reductase (NADH)
MLADKRLILTGVVTNDSIAYAITRVEDLAQLVERLQRSAACSPSWLPPTAARSSVWTSTPPGAWPVYNWMGVCKAALESVNRYLARDPAPAASAPT